EYLRYGRKGSRPALSISKMKAAYYPDAGLEQMSRHMHILSVVRIKVFSMYGYDYMKKIVLRRTDLNEHIIAEQDFKYMYPSDFEDLYLLNLQEDFQLGIESYQTQLNLTKPQWDATGFEYKHDYTIIDSPRAVMFWINMRKDVDQSKAFMFAIQKRLKTRRIFRNLESFVGGRLNLTKPQWDATGFEYKHDYTIIDSPRAEGRGSGQGVHVLHSKAVKDKEDLPQSGELCWWTRQRWRLQTLEAYRMITSFWHSRSISDAL
nr:hypothetical protein [Tanacetum cinerariifolium]